jgi:hypothetical protein
MKKPTIILAVLLLMACGDNNASQREGVAKRLYDMEFTVFKRGIDSVVSVALTKIDDEFNKIGNRIDRINNIIEAIEINARNLPKPKYNEDVFVFIADNSNAPRLKRLSVDSKYFVNDLLNRIVSIGLDEYEILRR